MQGALDAVDYYLVYVSNSRHSGFSILDTARQTHLTTENGPALKFYEVVAVNSGGSGGDEPAP